MVDIVNNDGYVSLLSIVVNPIDNEGLMRVVNDG